MKTLVKTLLATAIFLTTFSCKENDVIIPLKSGRSCVSFTVPEHNVYVKDPTALKNHFGDTCEYDYPVLFVLPDIQ